MRIRFLAVASLLFAASVQAQSIAPDSQPHVLPVVQIANHSGSMIRVAVQPTDQTLTFTRTVYPGTSVCLEVARIGPTAAYVIVGSKTYQSPDFNAPVTSTWRLDIGETPAVDINTIRSTDAGCRNPR